ncbi:single-stranded-DNA-specific exonuclease [Bajunvirus bajun]|uniref:Single-stranded-DNA-specific exonuclease n=1 Tax=Brevundimonas phage vB_BgoS-Bajun TaxID=2948594 RepID=A0A9E7N6F8_9CAUD|nr:single-stranded-DNA-specific exonuclease [Brevundimonas phage vB_BgoS-Bajun]
MTRDFSPNRASIADSYKPDVVLYHHPCSDGMGAAWAVWSRWPGITFSPASYEDDKMPDLVGKHVLIVDFSYKRDKLVEIASRAASVTLLDHHESAERDLAEWIVTADQLLPPGALARRDPAQYGPPIQALFDMKRSGAMMAWNYVFPGMNPPKMIQYIQDRDLWTWALPQSRAIAAYSQTVNLSFGAFEELHIELEEPESFARAADIGAILVERMDSEIKTAIKATKRFMTIGGHVVPVCNLPYMMASDGGNILSKGHAFAATYFDLADGRRKFSLRSDNTDPNAANVSLIAASYGGGGHYHAAGITMPKGWEGDEL